MARIEASSAASRAIHERCGFELVGIERQVGRKFNRWLDVRGECTASCRRGLASEASQRQRIWVQEYRDRWNELRPDARPPGHYVGRGGFEPP